MAFLSAVSVGGTTVPWESVGLTFLDSRCELGGVALIVGGGDSGMKGWTISVEEGSSVAEGEIEIDGIPTVIVHAPVGNGSRGPSPIGSERILGVDHVVVNTDDAERTCGAIGRALGLEVRRTRDAGHGVEQRFFKLDNSIIEVVSGPHTREAGTGEHRASLWGLVVSVDDLFELAESLGPEVLSPPKRAVQPGRFIATVRGSVGLGVPLAMMTPHYSSSSPAN